MSVVNTLEFVVDDHHGQYVPQVFVERFRDNIQHVAEEDLTILTNGPHDSEHYWEAWDYVLMNGTVKATDGDEWLIHQIDGGVFLSHPTHVWDQSE